MSKSVSRIQDESVLWIKYSKVKIQFSILVFCLILDSSDILEIPQFVANQSGSGWLLVDSHGFTYSKERTKKLKTYWKCSKRISSKCCARVSTVEMNIVSRSGQHNHLPPKKFEIQV